MCQIKIAVIGAGSSYTPELIEGFLDNDCFENSRVVLYDIDAGADKAKIIYELAKRMVKKSGKNINIELQFNLKETLNDCKFVISQFRVGLLNARVEDERVPLKYNLVGQETTGAGGFFKAMRTIPAALEIAHEMERICPDAWLINFTNPSGIITEAVNSHSRIKCVGLCNVPYNMQADAAKLMNTEPSNLYCEFVGLNHLSFISEIYHKSKPVMQKLIDEGAFNLQGVKNIPKVKGVSRLIKELGLIPSPYLQYFYFEKEMIDKQLKELSTAGTRAQQIKAIEAELFKVYKDINVCEKPKQLEQRGGALYSTVALMLIKALLGVNPMVQVVNYKNNGAINGIDSNSVVETNCFINSVGVHPLAYGDMPQAIAGLVKQVKAYETLTIRASVYRSRSIAIQALINNPLVHSYSSAVSLIDNMSALYEKYTGKLR